MLQAQAIQQATVLQSLSSYSVSSSLFALAASNLARQPAAAEQFALIPMRQEAHLGSFNVVEAMQIAASNDSTELNDIIASVHKKLVNLAPARTELGRRLLALRARAIAKGMHLSSLAEINEEIGRDRT